MTTNDPGLPEAAVPWLEAQIGSFQAIRACRIGSTRTGVWRLESEQGPFFFKVNRRKARWGTEVFAYRHWAVALDQHVPKLQGVFENETTPGILLEAISGVPLREARLSGGTVAGVYFRAGQLLLRLHGFAVGDWFGCVDENGLPMDWEGNPREEGQRDLVGQQRNLLQGFIERGRSLGCFMPAEMQILRWALGSVDCYASEVPIPTSEDYTPGNWLVDEGGQLAAIIDLENMLWGDRMLPFTRLLLDYFPGCPEGDHAFYEGYGGRRSRQESHASSTPPTILFLGQRRDPSGMSGVG